MSHDLTLGAMLPLEYGGETSAWQIEVTLRGLVYAAAAVILMEPTRTGEPAIGLTVRTRNIMAMWGQGARRCGCHQACR